MDTLNREHWLIKATKELKPLFKQAGHELPEIRVSVGFPGGGSARTRIGEHWYPHATEDGIGQIFISPIVADGVRALDILVHELVHAVAGAKAKHGPAFKRIALAVGLTGKMTATEAGPELKIKLEALIKSIGPYPHAKINLNKFDVKKQTTRMIKMECPDCGYICRASATAIVDHGPVICPCNGEQMSVMA